MVRSTCTAAQGVTVCIAVEHRLAGARLDGRVGGEAREHAERLQRHAHEAARGALLAAVEALLLNALPAMSFGRIACCARTTAGKGGRMQLPAWTMQLHRRSSYEHLHKPFGTILM